MEANEQSFGDKVIPDYHFDKANVIVSFGADFLGTWISPIEYAYQYAKNRKVSTTKNAKMSHHVQIESHMSLTGSNADNRILIKPSEQGAAIAALLGALGGGVSAPSAFKNAKAKADTTQRPEPEPVMRLEVRKRGCHVARAMARVSGSRRRAQTLRRRAAGARARGSRCGCGGRS